LGTLQFSRNQLFTFLELRRDTSVGPYFYYAGKFVDNVLTVAGNPEKARLATFPEMIPSASEAGQQPTLTSLPGQESNWRGQKQPWYDNKERNAFQACTPFVLRNYISTQTQVPLLLVSTHTHALIYRPAVGPKMGLNFSVLSKFGNFLSSIPLFVCGITRYARGIYLKKLGMTMFHFRRELTVCALSFSGVPGLSAATTKQVYERHFANKDTKEFEQFHIAYVEFCKWVSFMFCVLILPYHFITKRLPRSLQVFQHGNARSGFRHSINYGDSGNQSKVHSFLCMYTHIVVSCL
jgi:hypothetical protein